MLALSDLIDFLLDLLRDEDASAAFEQDPEAALAARGLGGVSADDVRDARLVLADDDAVRVAADTGHPTGGDAVSEIRYTTSHYAAEPAEPPPAPDPPGLLDRGPDLTIDDRDTFIFQNSFNSDDDVTIIDDSFTSDDDGIDTGGGDLGVDNSVTDTNVVAIDADNSFNQDNSVSEDNDTDVTAINESFNTDNSVSEDNSSDIDVLAIEDSFNDGTVEDATDATPDGADEAAPGATEQPEPDLLDEPDLTEADPTETDPALDLPLV